MQNREKTLVGVTILLVIIMLGKSLFFDEVKPKNSDEIMFKSFVEKRIADGKEELGLLNETGLASYKVVKIKKTNEIGESKILYYDQDKASYVEGRIKGEYKAKVRGYMLYIIPYKEFTVEVGE